MPLKDITYTPEGVLILRDHNELARYKCLACGEKSETALDGGGYVHPARPALEGAERETAIAQRWHPSNYEAQPERLFIQLAGHNGSTVDEIEQDEDGGSWEEIIRKSDAESEGFAVSKCCYAPCEQVFVKPEYEAKECASFRYMVTGITTIGYSTPYIQPGSFIRFNESPDRPMLGIVKSRAYYDGLKRPHFEDIWLNVTVLSEMLDYTMDRMVELKDILDCRPIPRLIMDHRGNVLISNGFSDVSLKSIQLMIEPPEVK